MNTTVRQILGANFHSIHRCVDMLCFNLGMDIFDKDKQSVPQYAFHIQTQWRFIKDHAILLASRDIYLPYSDHVSDDWEYDLVGRPDNESSLFDVVAKYFSQQFQDSVVTDIDISPLGDLHITFSNGIYFETFTPSCRKDEFWRLLIENNGQIENVVVFDA